MTKTCLAAVQGMNDDEVVIQEYEPDIGAPFKVLLIESVRQKRSETGDVLSTCIPNMGGLLKEVASARSLHNRKFSATELKFVRKAIGLRANDLAELLGVTAEHLSRCENGDRVLSASAEKLLRVIILKRRYNYAAISESISKFLTDGNADLTSLERVKNSFAEVNECISHLEKSVFETKLEVAHDASDILSFVFKLRVSDANDMRSQEEDEWKRSIAA